MVATSSLLVKGLCGSGRDRDCEENSHQISCCTGHLEGKIIVDTFYYNKWIHNYQICTKLVQNFIPEQTLWQEWMLALADSATGSMLLSGAPSCSVEGVMSSSTDSKSQLAWWSVKFYLDVYLPGIPFYLHFYDFSRLSPMHSFRIPGGCYLEAVHRISRSPTFLYQVIHLLPFKTFYNI